VTVVHDEKMSEPIDLLSLYLHLAAAAWKQRRMPDRDRFLILSARIAAQMNLDNIAAYCRYLILQNNPGHMVRKWPTLGNALQDADFLFFLKQIQRRFPQEKAETMLHDLKIDRSNERAVYFSDEEYAASILGVKLEWLLINFGDGNPNS